MVHHEPFMGSDGRSISKNFKNSILEFSESVCDPYNVSIVETSGSKNCVNGHPGIPLSIIMDRLSKIPLANLTDLFFFRWFSITSIKPTIGQLNINGNRVESG